MVICFWLFICSVLVFELLVDRFFFLFLKRVGFTSTNAPLVHFQWGRFILFEFFSRKWVCIDCRLFRSCGRHVLLLHWWPTPINSLDSGWLILSNDRSICSGLFINAVRLVWISGLNQLLRIGYPNGTQTRPRLVMVFILVNPSTFLVVQLGAATGRYHFSLHCWILFKTIESVAFDWTGLDIKPLNSPEGIVWWNGTEQKRPSSPSNAPESINIEKWFLRKRP